MKSFKSIVLVASLCLPMAAMPMAAQTLTSLPTGATPTSAAVVAKADTQLTALTGVNFDFLTNLPTVTDFTKMKFGLETGVASQNSVVANFIKVDYYALTNWVLSAEIQNAPVSTVVQNASFYAGWRKVWSNAEIYGLIGGRRNFASDGAVIPSYQVGALTGASWFPVTGGNVALTASLGIWSSPNAAFSAKPNTELRAGFKVGF